MQLRWFIVLGLVAAVASGCNPSTPQVREDRDPGTSNPPIVRAAVEQDFSQVRRLTEAGADLGARETIAQRTALNWAALVGNAQIAAYLIDHKAPLEARNDAEETPIYEAAFAGHGDVVALLIEAGASTSVVDEYAVPILVAAASSNNDALSTLRILLDSGVDVNQKGGEAHAATALHWASYFGRSDEVRFLLSRGADPEATDSSGKTPRDWAAGRNQSDVMEILDTQAVRGAA